ncbi:hypothetical protein [[Ruminococcus] lactaris]|uniref:hypothetical protein n=1 Tax=[Ruminococcus] lactaris TaxID=46228 RepID=UPI0035220ABE
MKKMKKMKKQFLSLFVLLCMIISMFPTTALAANIIDVSGKVTVDQSLMRNQRVLIIFTTVKLMSTVVQQKVKPG